MSLDSANWNNYLDVETYRNIVEKAFFQIDFPLKYKNSWFLGLATFAI